MHFRGHSTECASNQKYIYRHSTECASDGKYIYRHSTECASDQKYIYRHSAEWASEQKYIYHHSTECASNQKHIYQDPTYLFYPFWLQLWVFNCRDSIVGVQAKPGGKSPISEGMPLMAGFSIGSNGQIIIPAGMTNRVFINSTASRRKLFNNLLPSTTYYLYYVQMVGDVVSKMSAAVQVGSGVA